MGTSTSRINHRLHSLFTLIVIVAASLALPTWLAGQGYFGSVTGVLTDSSGAVLAHANVVLVDQEKGFTFKTTSDANARENSSSVGRRTISVHTSPG